VENIDVDFKKLQGDAGGMISILGGGSIGHCEKKNHMYMCFIRMVVEMELFESTSTQLCSVLLTKYHSDDQVKKTEVGRTCGTYEGEERCIQGFSGET
jgi:hypothetical protein